MAKNNSNGWVKSYRKMQESRVWPHHNASRAFQALLWAAETMPATAYVGDEERVINRGQVFTKYAAFAAKHYFSVDQVRRAFGVLVNLGMITCDGDRHGVLVTVLNYEKYQAVPAMDSMEGVSGGEGAETRREVRRESRHKTAAKTAAKKFVATGQGEKDCEEPKQSDRREERRESAAKTAGETAAPLLIGSKKNKKLRINPPTPFEKGGNDFSNSSALLGTDAERVEMVLATWREVLEAAGLSTLEGKRCRDGAELLAREYLAKASMSLKTLRAGMRKLAHDIANDPKCKLFDLKTLANNPRRYCPAPSIVRQKKPKVRWRWACDVCGREEYSAPLDASYQPKPYPCGDGNGCQGTMHPQDAEGVSDAASH